MYGTTTSPLILGQRQLTCLEAHLLAFLVVGISMSPSSRKLSDSVDNQIFIFTSSIRPWYQKLELPEHSPLFILSMVVVMSSFSKSSCESSKSPGAEKREAQRLNFPPATHNLISDSHGPLRPRLQIDPLRFGYLPSLSLLGSCGTRRRRGRRRQ